MRAAERDTAHAEQASSGAHRPSGPEPAGDDRDAAGPDPTGHAEAQAARGTPPRLVALALVVGVLVVYVPLALVTTMVLVVDGTWWPAALAFAGLVGLVVSALWTWIGEPRMLAAQAVTIALLLALSAVFFVLAAAEGAPDDPLSLIAILTGAAAASTFLASARAPGVHTRATRTAIGAACVLLALHLAVLPPLDWFFPVGTWGLALAVFVARAILTHPPRTHTAATPSPSTSEPSRL